MLDELDEDVGAFESGGEDVVLGVDVEALVFEFF